MSWIEFHGTDIIRLRKFSDFRLDLGWSHLEALGLLGSLWSFCIEIQEDGDLTAWKPSELLRMVMVPKSSVDRVWKALVKHGWVDQRPDGKILIHDWLSYAGRLLRGKYNKSDRDKLLKIWALHGLQYGNGPGVDKLDSPVVSGDLQKTYPTQPNLTTPNQTGVVLSVQPQSPLPPTGGTGDDVPEGETPCKTFLAELAIKFEKMSPRSEDRAKREQFSTYCQHEGRTAGAILRFCLGDRVKAMEGVIAIGRRMEALGLRWNLKVVLRHILEWLASPDAYELDTNRILSGGKK